VGALRPALLVLLGAVTLVLLIACTNVSHMLLARASAREREVGIRTALGATRGRIVRQLLTESLVLAVSGALAGLALAYLCLPILLRVAPLDEAQRAAVSIDVRVLGFTLAAAVVATVLFGLWPSLVASRTDVQAALKGDGARGATARGGWRTRGALVVSEVALASVLLAGAGLLLKSFEGLQRVDRGYDPTLVVSTGIVLPDNVYPKGADKREFMRRVLEQLRASPGVEAAAAANFLPRFGATQGEVGVAGRTEAMSPEARKVAWRVATPDYFRTLRIPVRRGRGIEESDQPGGARVVVVNETFANRFFPGQDPVGREVRLSTFGPPQLLRVVGVVGDVRHGGRTKDVEPDVFLPYAQNSWGYMNFVVRGRQTTPAALKAAISQAVRAVDPARPTFSQMELLQSAEADVAQPRFGAALMSLFAGVAALLACVGIFGVMAYTVAARTREIGIRIALGGQPRQVLGLVLRPGLALVAGGAVGGVLAALALGRVLASQLYGVRPSDPPVLLGVVLLVAAVGAAACYLPARRATRVDPLTALRAE
jgi:putative ABC transport system permease protein